MRISTTLALIAGALVATIGACSLATSLRGPQTSELRSAAADGVRQNVIPRLPPQDAGLIDLSPGQEPLLSLNRDDQTFVDVRGVGDSAFTGNQSPRAPAPGLAAALDRFNASGFVFRGDINVMNLESVIGESCGRYGGGFGFLTSPKAVVQALEKGFQVFSLSNNHSRDCNQTPEAGAVGDGGAGEITTARNMAALASSRGVLWNGVVASAPKQLVSTGVIEVGTESLRVAVTSIDLGRASCTRANCFNDRAAMITALRATEADLKVATFHSREWLATLSAAENLAQLNKIMETARLFVEQGGAHVVFGSGPHIAMPVRVLRRHGGGKGVAFLSLGNFIHPWLSAQSPNLIGRILFDATTAEVRQVQAIMVATEGASARPIDFQASSVFVSGLPWKTARDTATGLTVGYVNLARE